MKNKWKMFCICYAAAAAVILAVGFRAITQKPQQRQQQAPQDGYILIHTTDGEDWGFYGEITVLSDGSDGKGIDLEMSGWIVGSTHKCYCPEPWED